MDATFYLCYHENGSPLSYDPHNRFDWCREGDELILDIKHSHSCLLTPLLRYYRKITTVPWKRRMIV